MENLIYAVPAFGIIALIYTAIKSAWVTKQDAGNEKMTTIAKYIADGAMAFLKAEYKVLVYFVVIASLFLGYLGYVGEHSHPLIVGAFIIGAFFSALAGFIGMRIATKANVRTAQAARTSLSGALKVSFSGGSVMGLGVAGLAVLGLGSLFILFYYMFVQSQGASVNGDEMKTALEVLTGFSLGAESIALFARVGGGIYTKAADVGADLVGKVEAGIPEDDPRNPATIADNVGDNVGDVAGMGADLFGSYVATMLATMVLGREITLNDNFGGISPIILPMAIAGLGIVFSMIGTLFVKIKEGGDVQKALNLGNWSSIILTVIASYFLINWMLPDGDMVMAREGAIPFTKTGIFMAVAIGLIVGAIISMITEYYTSMSKRPVKSIVQQSGTGSATNIIAGLSVGMMSTALPVLVLAAGIVGSYMVAGLYGVAIAAAGMMATTAMQLAIDAFGPIADNAGGIAEMSELPKEVRERTDILDAVGNTTAATGKGFAIASAALTALALFAAFMAMAGINSIDISKANVLAGLFVGGMIPFLFSALAISAVGRAAMAMVHEVRRQFREIPGIMEGTGKPEYEKCVAISTKAAIREMILPGALALLVPVIVGFSFGPEVLGGVLAGVTVSGVLMAIFQCNAGGAWDNAKKSFEKGVEIDGKKEFKGSDAHKASVTGDTVGDPFKDTSGPSMNILIKLMSIVSLVIAPHIAMIPTADIQKTVGEAEVETIIFTEGVYTVNTNETKLEWIGKKVSEQHEGTVAVSGGSINTIDGGAFFTGDFSIDMNSLAVTDIKEPKDNERLLKHLKADDFFNVENHPAANFKVIRVRKLENKSFEVEGGLTIKGITKTVILPAEIVIEGNKFIATSDFSIDRTRWGIKYKSKTIFPELADKFILDDINFKLSLVAEK